MAIVLKHLGNLVDIQLKEAEDELKFLKRCSVEEMERNYWDWRDRYLREIEDSPATKIDDIWKACIDWLDEHAEPLIDRREANKIREAQAELKFLKPCSEDELERDYNNWRDRYLREIKNARTPESRQAWEACLDWLDEHVSH